jgi:hypothetical protein
MSDPAAVMNVQQAPYPDTLHRLINCLEYREGWFFRLEQIERDPGCNGLTLVATIRTQDDYDHNKPRSVVHYFPVPPATYNYDGWKRWLFDAIVKIETHEACEFFTLNGEKVFAPNHGPGADPYVVVQYSTDEARRTLFTGKIKDDS